jgi:hypothetical protein
VHRRQRNRLRKGGHRPAAVAHVQLAGPGALAQFVVTQVVTPDPVVAGLGQMYTRLLTSASACG